MKGYCNNCGKFQPMVDLEDHAPLPTAWVCPSVYYFGKCEVCGHPAVLHACHLKYSRECIGEFLIVHLGYYKDFLWERLPRYRRLAWSIARFFLSIAMGDYENGGTRRWTKR